MSSPHDSPDTGSGTSRPRVGPSEGAGVGPSDEPRAEPAEEQRAEATDVPPGGRPADYQQPLRTTAANATKAVGRGVGRATVKGARLTARAGRFTTRTYLGYTRSGGAAESGLARVTELHATHAAGDAAMMVALAGTVFLNPQTVQARDEVASFLLLTMIPFTLVAPFLGPLLDRVPYGRRWAIGTTMALRGFLCWVMAEALVSHSNWLFPAALAYLVASKAYTVVRAAAVPRVLPPDTTLVRANSKVSVAGIIGGTVGGALAGALMLVGAPWALRAAFVVFVVGTVQAIRLPSRIDSSEGELAPEDTAPIPLDGPPRPGAEQAGHPPPTDGVLTVDSLGLYGRARRRVRAIPWPVRHAMWSTGGTRLLTGFLILFMAFLAKEHPLDGLHPGLVLGLVGAAIGVGNACGSVLGNVLREHRPERVAMITLLVATVTCAATGVWYGLLLIAVIGLVQGLSAQLAKLCLDALIQREIEERVRTSVFGWSETMLQTLWVVGGALGIVLPLNPHVGFPVAAAALLGCVVLAARSRRVGRSARLHTVPKAAP
ncbi:MFS transporter [Intrasporangium sp.]|uniref:MFS transporter n=1 Tax=Intrasporangium sp. TaxID=1925024 RepID=UPI0032214596